MASESIEQRLERACKDHEIPGAVFVAESRDGKFRYEKAFGNRSLKDPSKPDPMPIDATMWLASCTKLLTVVAVMQCVEKGQLKLDDDVTPILPELKGIKILKGFEQGPDGSDIPILVENTKTITLRHLLTHTSGFSYDVFSLTPSLIVQGPLLPAFTIPLLFAPGESWEYGIGLDWAGWMVERVSGGITLEQYLNENVWAPLGVTSMSFNPKRNPATISKLVDISDREGGLTPFGTAANPNGKVVYTDNTLWNQETDGCAGGCGCYGAPLDYHKLLHSLLVDDEKILKKSSVEEILKPQLSDACRAAFMGQLTIPAINDIYGGGVPMGTKFDYALGGSLLMQDLDGRKKGTMTWGGHPNLIWFLDRAGGMAGITGIQINPPGDQKMHELYWQWEKEMYKRAGKEGL